MRVTPPFELFIGLDGKPLRGGYIYIGLEDKDPLTDPQQAYWDEALAIPADNIRTIDGYANRSGAPAQLYVGAPYSIRVENSSRELVYYRASNRIPDTDIILSQPRAQYELQDGQESVTIVSTADNCRVVQNKSKVIIAGLTRRTTAGEDG